MFLFVKTKFPEIFRKWWFTVINQVTVSKDEFFTKEDNL